MKKRHAAKIAVGVCRVLYDELKKLQGESNIHIDITTPANIPRQRLFFSHNISDGIHHLKLHK